MRSRIKTRAQLSTSDSLHGNHRVMHREIRNAFANRDSVMRRHAANALRPDRFEHEADTVAETVVHTAKGNGQARRDDETVATVPVMDTRFTASLDTPLVTRSGLNRLGSGALLSSQTRDIVEPVLGHNLSAVRVHYDSVANSMAHRLGARAFTAGSHVAFANGEYRPGAISGLRLLAHEMTHVMQQGGVVQASDRQAKAVNAQLQLASDGPASPEIEKRTVQGKGGYTYEQYPDGSIVIRSGPGIRAPVRLTNGTAFDAITAEIGQYPGSTDIITGDVSRVQEEIPEGGQWLDWLAEQAGTVGEAAADLFVTAGDWADGLMDTWYSDDAPAQDVPVKPGDRSEKAEAAKLEGMTGTPLELALEKVGQVAYVDPTFGQGAGKRKFSDAETKALKTGSQDIRVASCSPFAYWTLAASGIDINEKIEGDSVSIREYINIEEGALKGGDYKSLVRAGDERISGAAHAFTQAGIGTEVEQEDACPGDYVQTYSSGYGGHSTIVHRAHCRGAAIFGVEGSPTPVDPVPGGDGAHVAGFDSEPVRFILDEKTKPATVGNFVTEKVELLGAHLGGTSSTGDKMGPGVYTKRAVSLGTYFQAFVGRLSTSVWTNHKPADPAGLLESEDSATPDTAKRSWWSPW